MQGAFRSNTWTRLTKLRRQRRVQTVMTFALVLLGPILAVTTFLALGLFTQVSNMPSLRLILLADIVYVLVVAALVMSRVGRMSSDGRSRSAGSQLRLRLTRLIARVGLTRTARGAVWRLPGACSNCMAARRRQMPPLSAAPASR